MPIDFSALLSLEARARMAHGQREATRIHGLPDRMLAREIVRLARAARRMLAEAGHGRLADPRGGTYDANLLWHVIPGLAHNLGERTFEPNERQDPDGHGVDGPKLRERVSDHMKNNGIGHALGYRRGEAVANPCYLIGQPPCHGNPIAIALDRAAPPTPDSDDWCARTILEVARARFGQDATDRRWTPDFGEAWRRRIMEPA